MGRCAPPQSQLHGLRNGGGGRLHVALIRDGAYIIVEPTVPKAGELAVVHFDTGEPAALKYLDADWNPDWAGEHFSSDVVHIVLRPLSSSYRVRQTRHRQRCGE